MEKWENPAIPSEHLLNAHPFFHQERVSLGGKWRFLAVHEGEPLPEGWEKSDFEDKKWSKLPIPGHLSHESSPRLGLYRRSFTLSGSAAGLKTILELSYGPECALVWVNGEYMGMIKGFGFRGELDISRAIRPQKNTVAILVSGGAVPGDICLYTLPQRHIADVQTEVRGLAGESPLLLVHLAVAGGDGLNAGIALMEENQVIAHAQSRIIAGQAQAVLECGNIKRWSRHCPALYRLAVVLLEGTNVIHTRELSVGFREVSLEGGRFSLNGRDEKLMGLWYQPTHAETGCLLPEADLARELETIRAHNFNTLCLSAPAPEFFYAICDRLGLYVVDSCGQTMTEENRNLVQSLAEGLSHAHGIHPCILAWESPMANTGVLPFEAFSGLSDPSPEAIARAERPTLCHFFRTGNYGACVSAIRENPACAGAVWGSFRGRSDDSFVSPEGGLRPVIRELQQLLQPFSFQYKDELLTITNHSVFPIEGSFRCLLTNDGAPVTEKTLDVSVAPGTCVTIPLETRYDIYKPGRYHLTAEFQDALTGTVTAREQWTLNHLKHIYDENPGGAIREEAGTIGLRSQTHTYILSRGSGILEQILVGESRMLAKPLLPLFQRRIPSGFHIPGVWETMSSRKKWKPSVLEVDHMTRTVTGSYHAGSGLMLTHRLFGDGAMTVELRLRTGRTAPECIGFRCKLADSLNRCSWFGLGPDDGGTEKPGRFYAIHTMDTSGSDNGCKEQVYRICFTDASGHGFALRSEDGLRFSWSKDGQGSQLTLLLPLDQEPKAHTTYTFSFTLEMLK